MLSKFKNVAGAVTELASNTTAKVSEMAAASADQLSGSLEEIANGSDEIRAVGYELEKVAVEVGIIPKISLAVAKLCNVDNQDTAKVIERNKDKKSLAALLRALSKADDMMRNLQLRGRQINSVEIDLSVPPVVRFVFQLPK